MTRAELHVAILETINLMRGVGKGAHYDQYAAHLATLRKAWDEVVE